MNYLTELAQVDDFEEINFLELLRHGHFITKLSEGEVTNLIAGMREEEQGGQEFGELRQVFMALLFARMAELNGPEAMRMAVADELGKQFEGDEDDLMTIGMSSWVDADPEGAAAWFREAGAQDPKFREALEDEDVQQAFYAAMARHDMQMALELLHEQGGEALEDNMEVVARYEKSIEGLQGMLQSADGDARYEVFEVMSARDPAAAAAWLGEQGGIENRDRYVWVVGEAMLERGAPDAVEWYMAQELTADGDAMRSSQIVDHLAGQDATKASNWLEAQPDTPARDRAEDSLARHWNNEANYAESFRWVNEISDDTMRTEAAESMIRQGWDREEQRMQPDLDRAAREAGYGGQLDAIVAERSRLNRNER
jgi:hypothetical protein